MDISNCYLLYDIIRELEVAYQIEGEDFEETDTDIVIKRVKQKLGRQYQINIMEFKATAPELEMSQFRNSLSLLIDNITAIHAKVCGYTQIERYTMKSGISLSDINYLGFTEVTLKETLIALQRQDTMPLAEESIQAIKTKLGTISNCWEKRIFVLLVVSYELGFYEMTAALAEILFQGMI